MRKWKQEKREEKKGECVEEAVLCFAAKLVEGAEEKYVWKMREKYNFAASLKRFRLFQEVEKCNKKWNNVTLRPKSYFLDRIFLDTPSFNNPNLSF